MRYPTRQGGLIVPPTELGFHAPTPEQFNTRRLTTNHHGYFERHRYADLRYRMVFRNLVSNVYNLLADEHVSLHEQFDAPKRPRDSLMIEVLDDYLVMNGVIECIREKQTRQTYQIQPEEWRHIKRGYRNETGLGRRPSVQPAHVAS
jgi:hypothetical protein